MQTIQFEHAVEQSTGGNQAVPTLRFFANFNATISSKNVSWNDFAAMVANPTVKEKERAAVLTPYDSINKTKEAAEASLFNVLVGDLDNVPYGMHRLVDNIRTHGHLGALIVYTTASHMVNGNSNRYRVLIPLNEPVDAATYKTLVTGLNQILGKGADKSTANVNQVFFAPNKTHKNNPYDFYAQDGEFLCTDFGFCELLRTTGRDVIIKKDLPDVTQMTHRVTESQSHKSHRVTSSITPPEYADLQLPDDCIPKTEGQRNKIIFTYARFLKTKYSDLTLRDLKPLVVSWHNQFLNVIGTKEFSATWIDFATSFNSVKFPYGAGVEYAIEMAKSVDLPQPVMQLCLETGYGENVQNLIKVMFSLAEIQDNDGLFFIGQRDAAKILGVASNKTAGRYLNALCGDGLIRLIEKGTQSSKGTATIYCLMTDRDGNF